MHDITTTHLEAAIIDQTVAGLFHDRRYAFTPVLADVGWALGIAVADEEGYHPLAGKTFAKLIDAKQWADGLNFHIGHTPDDVLDIVSSTMRGRRTMEW